MKLLILDIETAPDETFAAISLLKPKPQMSNPDTIAAYMADPENRRKEYENRSKSPIFGKIVALGIQEAGRPAEIFMGSERDILLNTLASLLKRDLREYFICAYLGYRFDFPFVAYRAMQHAYQDPRLNALAKMMQVGKPWESPLRDIAGFKFAEFVSMEHMCLSMGIYHPSPKGGSEVYGWLQRGRMDLVEAHLRDDLNAEFDMATRLHAAGML